MKLIAKNIKRHPIVDRNDYKYKWAVSMDSLGRNRYYQPESCATLMEDPNSCNWILIRGATIGMFAQDNAGRGVDAPRIWTNTGKIYGKPDVKGMQLRSVKILKEHKFL